MSATAILTRIDMEADHVHVDVTLVGEGPVMLKEGTHTRFFSLDPHQSLAAPLL